MTKRAKFQDKNTHELRFCHQIRDKTITKHDHSHITQNPIPRKTTPKNPPEVLTDIFYKNVSLLKTAHHTNLKKSGKNKTTL